MLWKRGEKVANYFLVGLLSQIISKDLSLLDPRQSMAPRFLPSTEFDPLRPGPGASAPTFYSGQRFGPRPTEVDPAIQAKRRMAAQRERDLRNYHQEQQFQKRT